MLIWRGEEKWRKKKLKACFRCWYTDGLDAGRLISSPKHIPESSCNRPRWDFINKGLGQPHVMDYKGANQSNVKNTSLNTTAHSWYNDHSTSINACWVWRVRVGIQVSRRELHTHIYLNEAKVEILSCIKKRKEKKNASPNCIRSDFSYIML